MAARRTIRIDVISDFSCAWCYIGHIEIEKGLALARARGLPVDFTIQYHPFLLNSSVLGDQIISKEEYYSRKFEAPEVRSEILRMVIARGKEEGINFSFKGNMRQTTRSHRLLQKAHLYGGQRAQTALIKRLFRAFFEDEQDIGDAATLAKLASSQTYPFSSPANPNGVTNGVNDTPQISVTKFDGAEFDPHEDDDAAAIFDSEEEAMAWVEGTEYEKEVRSMSLDAARKGVQGVPFTVIDGRWAVSGCQQPECYYKIFEKLAHSDGSAQTPKGECVQKVTICKTGSACHSV